MVNSLKIWISDVGPSLVVELPYCGVALSSSVITGGLRSGIKYVVISHVEEHPVDLAKWIYDLCREIGLKSELTIVHMTAVDVRNYLYERCTTSLGNIEVIATIGLEPPITYPRPRCEASCKHSPSTINIVVVTPVKLEPWCLVELCRLVTEAKVAALLDLEVTSGGLPVISTLTDSVTIVCPEYGSSQVFSGYGTEVGEAIANTVYSIVCRGISRVYPVRDYLKKLHEFGIDLEMLVKLLEKFYVPHPGGDLSKGVKFLENVFKDGNTLSIIAAALKLDQLGRKGLLPGFSREDYLKDSVHLLADELLGLTLSLYLGGWLAVFEYYRIEREKDRVPELRNLPPFLDDIVSALLASALVRSYGGSP